jgi:transcriptional regulator with XRE-family HTH domain
MKGEAWLRRELGQRIVHLRESRGMTRWDLARHLGVDRSRLGKWETGSHAPPIEFLPGLAEALEITLDELLTGRAPAGLPPQARETIREALRLLGALVEVPSLDEDVKHMDDSVHL